MKLKHRIILKNFFFNLYAKFFTIIFWQPVIWNFIKPKNGIIDNKSKWFHRHAVKCLNQCRQSEEGFVIMRLWKLKIRDPYSYPMKSRYKYSKKHLFVI